MYPFEHKALAILISTLFLAQAYGIARAVGTYIFPAALFALAWFAFSFVPLVLLIQAPINCLSLLFIFACISAFSLSALFFDWQRAFAENDRKRVTSFDALNSGTIRHCLYVTSLLSVVFSSLSMISNGFDLSSIIFNLIETSGRYASLRGQEEIEYGLVGLCSVFFTYLTPALGGLIYLSESARSRGLRILAFSLAPALYYMLTQSTKNALLLSVVIFVSSVMLAKLLSGDYVLFRKSKTPRLAFYALVLIPLVSISFLSREGYSNYSSAAEALSLLSYAFLSYALGEIYAFSDFFSYYVGMHSTQAYKEDYFSLGYYTFKSIFDMFGGTKVFPPGYYEEGFELGDVFATNIFTAFRSFIYDFGIFGTILFMFCLGLVIHGSYYRVLVARRPWFSAAAFVVFSVFMLMTYLASVFTARYMFLMGLGLYVILLVSDKRSAPAAAW